MTRSQLESTTLGEIVASDFRTGSILDRFGLDYCCGGARSLDEGCRQKGVDVDRVISEIAALDPQGREAISQDPPALVDHIITRHHTYVRMMAPLIAQHLAKVVARHASRHPELRAIAQQFDTLIEELRLHMMKEEQVLFPYIKALAKAVNEDDVPPPDMFGTVQNPIRMMETEHQEAGDTLASIRELSHDYVVPDDACTTLRLVFEELDAFEKDLHLHVHLENNVLFPQAIELEEKAELKARALKCRRWEAEVLAGQGEI
jgi:regulator of cell morphogenesis and NO signaling